MYEHIIHIFLFGLYRNPLSLMLKSLTVLVHLCCGPLFLTVKNLTVFVHLYGGSLLKVQQFATYISSRNDRSMIQKYKNNFYQKPL